MSVKVVKSAKMTLLAKMTLMGVAKEMLSSMILLTMSMIAGTKVECSGKRLMVLKLIFVLNSIKDY
jgi:hypothetical protein